MSSILEKPLQERTKMCNSLIKRYPSRIPIILKHGSNIKGLSKYKFLVCSDMTISVFCLTVKRYIETDEKYGIFLSCQGLLPPGSSKMCELHRKYKSPDNFLYITVNSENSFG